MALGLQLLLAALQTLLAPLALCWARVLGLGRASPAASVPGGDGASFGGGFGEISLRVV